MPDLVVLGHFNFAVDEELMGLRGLELEKPPPEPHGISEEGFWRGRNLGNGTSRESWLNISAVMVVPDIFNDFLCSSSFYLMY